MFQRHLVKNIREALSDTPVVFLRGARQTGKTTLVRELLGSPHDVRYMTLDDVSVMAAAANDPQGFLAGVDRPLILDEVQRAPGLLPALKQIVDEDRKPGQFLLTGSANVLSVPRVSESLAGRMEILTLWPLAQAEIESREPCFIDRAMKGEVPPCEPEPRDRVVARLVAGGFPEPLQRRNQRRRSAWFESYITTLLERDVRDLANIEHLIQMPRLLSILASQATGLQNFAELSRTSGIPQSTLKRYLNLLEMIFLIRLLPAWSGNLGLRLIKSPKLLVVDTGLMAHLLGLDVSGLSSESPLIGLLLENLVAVELLKQAPWSDSQPKLYHFRTSAGREVGLVLEDAQGNIVGIETKAGQTVRSDDLKGLRALAEALPKDGRHRLRCGFVLYTGDKVIPFGDRLYAVPVSALWSAVNGDGPRK